VGSEGASGRKMESRSIYIKEKFKLFTPGREEARTPFFKQRLNYTKFM
jgi:hypothetical protein